MLEGARECERAIGRWLWRLCRGDVERGRVVVGASLHDDAH